MVAFVVSDILRMRRHGYGLRALHQSLQLRARRRLRPRHRAPQHLPLRAGGYLRLHVRRAADDYRHAHLRRAVRYENGPCRALHARLHEHPHAAGLSRRGGGREPRPGAAARRPARPVERPAAHLRHRRRGHRRGPGHRRAAAGHHGRYGHRGDAAPEVRGHQVLDGHPAGRRFGGAVGSGGHRLRRRSPPAGC